MRRERRRYHEMIRALIEEGQADGVFRADVRAELCVDYFCGAVHHLPTWWRPAVRLDVGRSVAALLRAASVPTSRPVGTSPA